MHYQWIGNLVAIGIRGLSLLSKFLLMFCLVKYFQASEVGLYGILTALIAYTLFFCGLEYYNYILRALVDVRASEQVLIIRDQFILYSIVYIIISPLIYLLFQSKLLPYTLCFWFFILVVFEHISNELMRILVALSRPYLANFVFFIRQGLWIYLLLPLFYLYPASRNLNLIIIAWTLGAILSIAVAGIGLYQLPWKKIGEHPINWHRIKQGLLISRPFIITAFCALSLLYIERFFINYYCGIAAVGVYTFYSGLSVSLHNLVNAGVSKIRLPQLLAAWKQKKISTFQNEILTIIQYTTAFVILFSICIVVSIHPFLRLIDKEIYAMHLPSFYLLLFGAACRSIADAPLYAIYAQHKDQLLLIINLVAFGVMLIGNIILVPRYGLLGAAFASAGASFVLLSYALLSVINNVFYTDPALQP